MEEKILFWEAWFMILRKELPIQSYQLKQDIKVWTLFKIKTEDNRTMSMASF